MEFVIRPRLFLAVPLALAFVAASVGSGCASADVSSARGTGSDHEEPEENGPLGQSVSALVNADPVSKAVTDSCTTSAVKGLATQLVEEIQCLRPGTMARIDGIPNTTLGASVFPFLQAPAATALRSVAKTRTVPLVINSALRTLPQQYLLYRWYQTGRCGIGLAAAPGRSNHESGVAVDVNDNAGWRAGFQGNGWRWLGASDPVHYDYTAGGVSLTGLSVRAFQRLWNRNNPTDKIAEDGAYGPSTETRLARSPIGGFAVGASCPEGGSPTTDGGAGTDGGAPPLEPPDLPNDAPITPDAPEPDSIPDGPGAPSAAQLDSSSQPGGCSSSPWSSGQGGMGLGLGLAFAALVTALRRRVAT